MMTSHYVCYKCGLEKAGRSAPVGDTSIQSRLSTAGSGQLTINQLLSNGPPQTLDRSSVSGDCGILKLPNELLCQIFDLVFSVELEASPVNPYPSAAAVVTVCRRFNQIGTTFLYHSARFETACGVVPPCYRAKNFHNTLKQNPLLRPLIRDFRMYISDVPGTKSDADYDLANDLVTMLPNVRRFVSRGGFAQGKAEDAWAFLTRAIKHMPLIESITIDREVERGLSVQEIVQNLNVPSLKALEVIGVRVHEPLFRPIFEDDEDSGTEFEVLDFPLPENHEATATFTSLELRDFNDRPEACQALIKWPKTLVHLKLTHLRPCEGVWTFKILGKMLEQHKDSLKTLAIDSMSRIGPCINLTTFPNLEKVTLSSHELMDTQFPEDLAINVLGPKVHTFVFDYHVYWSLHYPKVQTFTHDDQEYILRFAQSEAARTSALKRIMVDFPPDGWSLPETVEDYKEAEYPWDRMDLITEMIRPLGISFEYLSPPTLTREQAEERIRIRLGDVNHLHVLRDSDFF